MYSNRAVFTELQPKCPNTQVSTDLKIHIEYWYQLQKFCLFQTQFDFSFIYLFIFILINIIYTNPGRKLYYGQVILSKVKVES